MLFKSRVFCMGEKPEDCIAGMLETMQPVKVDDVHTIKGDKWKCSQVSKNINGETLLTFRLNTKQ